MLALVAVVVLVGAACDVWPSARGGPDQTGFNAGETTVDATNATGLAEHLQYDQLSSGINGSPVVGDGEVYVATADGTLAAFDTTGTRACSGSPATSCRVLWQAHVPSGMWASPTVSGDRVFAVSAPRSGGFLEAFSTAEDPSCWRNRFASPYDDCAPQWRADAASMYAPTVAGGVVYVIDSRSAPATLLAFDAAGVTNCSGSPVVCLPLWSAPTPGAASPTVSDGLVFVSSGTQVAVFDAAGVNGCSGTPTVCGPVRTVEVGATGYYNNAADPVQVGTGITRRSTTLSAFDATSTTGCSAAPIVCPPRWTATVPQEPLFSQPALAYGNVYVPTQGGRIEVFDQAGLSGCAGTPTVCTPLRSITWDGSGNSGSPGAPAFNSSITIANGVGYLGLERGNGTGALLAFDVRSTAACTGVPLTCPVLWSAPLAAYARSTPAVADGRVYIGTEDGRLHVFSLS